MIPTHVIIHCSATQDSGTVSWQAIRRYHTGTLGWSDIGYHFGVELVGKTYEVLAGRPIDRKGAHCRAAGMNNNALGICFVGDYDHEPPPPEMLALGARYVAGLCRAFRIPAKYVIGHRDVEDRKTCPGLKFDMDAFRDLLRGQ